MARKGICHVTTEGSVVTFAFEGGATEVIDYAKLSDEMKLQCALHGIIQKGRDAHANAKGDVNWAQAQTGAVFEALRNGSWKRNGGGTGNTILVEAVARVKEYDMAKAAEVVANLDDAQIEQLKAAPSIVAAIATIRAERKQESAKANKGKEKGILDML